MKYSLIWPDTNNGFIFDECFVSISKKVGALNVTEQGIVSHSLDHDHGFSFGVELVGTNIYATEDNEHEN